MYRKKTKQEEKSKNLSFLNVVSFFNFKIGSPSINLRLDIASSPVPPIFTIPKALP
jgi:hypothetical protein